MTEHVYRLEEVTKRYGASEVCHIDYLEVPKGSILVLIGPNGAGKSTLLRLMGFLEPPTSGRILFKGHSFSNGTGPPVELRRLVTMVFQTPTFLNGTVERNVAYGLRVRGERHIKTRVSGVLEAMGLFHMGKARASTLSAGEAQRIALARSLIFNPEVLLLDEPTANLDPHNVALVEQLITEVNRGKGTTVVLVTQNVFQAKRLADQVVFMLDGKLVEAGSAGNMFAGPEDPRTLAFIRGEMVV
jgi:tungstate transport system ATP-binding protein